MFKLPPVYLPVLLLLIATVGCGPSQAPPTASSGGDAVGHDHDGHDHGDGDGHDDGAHGHEGHDHESLGPNGGHVLVVGDEAYHVEWMHDDESGKVTAILLDSEMKNEVATTSDVVTITVTIGDGEPRTYRLAAIDQSDDTPPKASRFELTEPALTTALGIGEGVQVVLHVEIDDQVFDVPIEHEAHDDHAGHNH
jgi:hypothetical protein